MILFLLIASCKPTKNATSLTIEKSDTLIVKSEIIKAPVLSESLVIHNICDTITNTVVRFEKVFTINGDSIKILTNKNNELSIEIDQREKELSKRDSIIRSKSSDSKYTSIKKIYRKDPYWIAAAFLLGYIFCKFKLGRVIFRKIPFLNKL